jgi:hypothetical protein
MADYNIATANECNSIKWKNTTGGMNGQRMKKNYTSYQAGMIWSHKEDSSKMAAGPTMHVLMGEGYRVVDTK